MLISKVQFVEVMIFKVLIYRIIEDKIVQEKIWYYFEEKAFACMLEIVRAMLRRTQTTSFTTGNFFIGK